MNIDYFLCVFLFLYLYEMKQIELVEIKDFQAQLNDKQFYANTISTHLLQNHKRIEKLQLQIKLLAEKMQQIPDDMGILRPEEEPLPPHY